MPELPEVEIQVRLLRRALGGQRLTSVRSFDPKLRLPARRLVGRRIMRIRRRAKYLIFDLDNGAHLLAHLRMTGWFERERPVRPRAMLQAGGRTVWFEDSRRFGQLALVTTATVRRLDARLGPEPLAAGFSFDGRLRTRRPIKNALLDQGRVAGVGNIYASESLWWARINPQRPADTLTAPERRRLAAGLRAALRKAVAYGPRIFAVQTFAVYDRETRPCRRCRTRIRRISQAGRSTFYCPRCQRR